MPRDRAGTCEPKIVRKRQRRLMGVADLVVSLVAKGLTTGEIQVHSRRSRRGRRVAVPAWHRGRGGTEWSGFLDVECVAVASASASASASGGIVSHVDVSMSRPAVRTSPAASHPDDPRYAGLFLRRAARLRSRRRLR